jgi:hypothetical protein
MAGAAMTGCVVSKHDVGSWVQVPDGATEAHFVLNVPETFTPDLRELFEVKGFTFDDIVDESSDPLAIAKRTLDRCKREDDTVHALLAVARASTPRTPATAQAEAQHTESSWRTGQARRDAQFRYDTLASAPAAV